MHDITHHLIVVSGAYSQATGLSRSRVSTLVLGGGTRLASIASGRSDLATRTYERTMQWFSNHWPADTPWPEGIERPQASTNVADGPSGERAPDGSIVEVRQ